MKNNKPPIAAILGMTAIIPQVKSLYSLQLSRKKNWRILSLWRELRRNKIKYYFLSQNQIVIEPLQYRRTGFIVSIEKMIVPMVSFTVDFYKAKNIYSGTEVILNCTSGISLMKKLVSFSFLHADELQPVPYQQRYEPFQYCPVCGERNRLSDYKCELCGAKLP